MQTYIVSNHDSISVRARQVLLFDGLDCPAAHVISLDLAVHQTLAHGGEVWAIRHQQDLAPVEGIGALLRF